MDDNPEFYCWKHLKDLIGIPTQITFVNHNNGIIYITHPFYDKVPFNEGCVNYEVVSDYEEGEHKDIKSSQKDILSLIQKDLSDKDKVDLYFVENSLLKYILLLQVYLYYKHQKYKLLMNHHQNF